jgi:hypothetical protein
MGLIDADKILDKLSGMIKIMDDYDAVKKAINDMPTTYDVDKVVAQLERDKFIESETTLSDVHQGYNAGLSRAIEIVKDGGVNG